MNTTLVSTVRRWRRRWVATGLMVVLSSLSVALLVALAAITDGVLIREVFPGADQMVVFNRPDRVRAWQIAFPLEEVLVAAADAGIPVTAFDEPRRTGPEPDAPRLAMVAADFFEFVGQRPQAGRLLQPADTRETRLAVIGSALWRRKFGGDPNAVGRSLTTDEATYTIVGVAAPQFDFPRGTDIWTVIDPNANVAQLFRFLGKRPLTMSATELAARSRTWQPTPLRDYVRPADGRQLVVLAAVGGLLLLTVWIHLALSQLADAVGRINEFRVRMAIGADRWHILRAGLTDIYLIVAGCVALGGLLAPAVLTMLASRLPSPLLTGKPVAIDGRSAWLLVVCLVIGWLAVTIATLPALRTSFRSTELLAGSTRSTAVAAGAIRWIVGLQFLSATAVLYLLGLAASSMSALIATDLGYEPRNVLAIAPPEWSPPGPFASSTDTTRQAWISKLQATLDDLRRQPGVIAVGTSSDRPGLSPGFFGPRVWLPEAGIDRAVRTENTTVGGDYFESLQVPLVAGRWFDPQLDHNRPKRGWDEMVIDTTLATALGLDRTAVGRELSIGGFPTKVIGIAAAIRPREPDQTPRPRYYLKLSAGNPMALTLLVRYAGDGNAIRTAASRVVQEHYATPMPPYAVFLIDEIERLRAPYRGRFEILSFAGWMTAGLTIVGVFGVCAYTVARRRRELAVRMAMGATRGQILWASLRALIVASSAGTAAGLLVGLAMGTQLSAALYSVTPVDTWVLTTIPVVAVAIAALGAFVPVRRAWATDVSSVLRQD